MPLFAETEVLAVVNVIAVLLAPLVAAAALYLSAKAKALGEQNKKGIAEAKAIGVDNQAGIADIKAATDGLVEKSNAGAQAAGEIKGRADERSDRAADNNPKGESK
jgi:uncharacterized iron-regulated protein